MNKKRYQKAAAAVLSVMMAGSLLAGCGQEPEETRIDPVTTTAPTTEPATVPTTEPLDTTIPEETNPVETIPEETFPEETIPVETEPQVDAPEPGSISYEEYLELEVEVQEAYFESFENADAFFAWLDEAQAAYEATRPTSSDFEEGVEDWE